MLTEHQIAQIKGMHRRGDKQMWIAVYFGINQGRVNELIHGKRAGRRFEHVVPAPLDQLPEPGPYVIIARSTHDRQTVAQGIVNELRVLLDRYTAQIDLPSG